MEAPIMQIFWRNSGPNEDLCLAIEILEETLVTSARIFNEGPQPRASEGARVHWRGNIPSPLVFPHQAPYFHLLLSLSASFRPSSDFLPDSPVSPAASPHTPPSSRRQRRISHSQP
ncbi:hypothetical protein A0H81_04101 [Grifola frondosa]|uniref:Uncharacterized protein n=1 Tax=Grifola frondosa TaxID=5627 RepID=A0A1C7MEP2_GRIFR|nr:hypothetical protein A0H81_04101 [Grifola frondosa]